MKCIILAAGRGKRLRPLTDHVAKALIPIKGKPIIGAVLKNLKAVQADEIFIVVGYLREQVIDYLSGNKIKFVWQKKQLGTAHALKLALNKINEDVFVTACDSILPSGHLKALQCLHFKENCDATLSLKILKKNEILKSSTVKLEKNGRITKIIEKPSKNEILSSVASSPVYIFKPVVKEYLAKVKKSKRGEYEIQDAIQMMIDDGLKVKGLISPSWKHLSDLRDLVRLNRL